MISNPEVNRTLATLRKAELGFLGLIVEKSTDKSSLLSLYRTVHESFPSYGQTYADQITSYNKKKSFSVSIPLPLILWESEGSFSSFHFFIFRVSISSFWIWALLSSTSFFGFILYLFHFDFSLFLYPYPLGTAFASIENFFLCMNRYYSIPISSRNFPRKIPNWIQNWRVNVSLSMRLGTLQIGIHFLTGFRALVGRPRSFRWPMLSWRDMILLIA